MHILITSQGGGTYIDLRLGLGLALDISYQINFGLAKTVISGLVVKPF